MACCFLDSATALLEDYGIPTPERVEFLQHRFDVFPGCCSALLLRDVSVTNATPGDSDCGISLCEINWELQYTQCVTLRDPACLEAGDCDVESGNCRDELRCPPGDVHQFDCMPCETQTKAQETDMISSARWVLTKCLAEEVKKCLCDPAAAPYPDECVDECGTSFNCQYLRLNNVQMVDGGGCAGFVMRFQSRHL